MHISLLKQKILNRLSIRSLFIKQNRISINSTIHPTAKCKGSDILGNIKIGERCIIKESSLYGGNIEVGRFTVLSGPNIDMYCLIHDIKIGNFCSIARNTSFQEYGHNSERFTTFSIESDICGKPVEFDKTIVSKGGIKIGHDVWIGAQCVILGGANIGNGAIIAANSVVIGDIPPYSIAAGSPAKVIKYRFEPEVIEKIQSTCWWDWDIEVIKEKVSYLDNIVRYTGSISH